MCGFSHGRDGRSRGCRRPSVDQGLDPGGAELRWTSQRVRNLDRAAPAGEPERVVRRRRGSPPPTPPPGRRCRRPRSSPGPETHASRTRRRPSGSGARTCLQTSSCLRGVVNQRRPPQVQLHRLGRRRASNASSISNSSPVRSPQRVRARCQLEVVPEVVLLGPQRLQLADRLRRTSASRPPSSASVSSTGSVICWLNGIPGNVIPLAPADLDAPAVGRVAERLRRVEVAVPELELVLAPTSAWNVWPSKSPEHVLAVGRVEHPEASCPASPSTGSSKRSGHSKKPSIRLANVQCLEVGRGVEGDALAARLSRRRRPSPSACLARARAAADRGPACLTTGFPSILASRSGRCRC